MSIPKKRIMIIIQIVASKQMYDPISQQFRDELINEAYLGVMEAMQKAKTRMTEATIFTIAKRRLLQYKCKNTSPLHVPMNSAYWWGYKQKRGGGIGLELKEELIPIQRNWKDEEVHKDLKMIAERVYKQLSRVERRVQQGLLRGETLKAVWLELRLLKIKNIKRRVYAAPEQIRKTWEKELGGKYESCQK